jgi:hypothetical protein
MNYDNIKTSLLIPGDLSRALDSISVQTDVPKATLMRQAVQAFVEQHGLASNLRHVASAVLYCELALDHIIGISAPEKRDALKAAAEARMEQIHVAR